MFITCAMSRNVPYKDAKGTVQLCTLRPGRHNYPMLNPAVGEDGKSVDPLLVETLRTLRKLRFVKFDELLPGDHEILASTPEGKDPVKHLAENVLSRTSHVGRHVNEKSEERIAKEAKAAKEKEKTRHARGGDPKAQAASGRSPKGSDNSSEPGGVSDKK